jgi:hypothetical protein
MELTVLAPILSAKEIEYETSNTLTMRCTS